MARREVGRSTVSKLLPALSWTCDVFHLSAASMNEPLGVPMLTTRIAAGSGWALPVASM